jgi:hypothetical protein
MKTNPSTGASSGRIPPSDPEVLPWNEFATAVRRELSLPPPENEAAPFGFATRVVSQWVADRREQTALLWQRWSFRAAVFSVIIALFAVLAARPSREAGGVEGAILPFPGLEVPLPTNHLNAL